MTVVPAGLLALVLGPLAAPAAMAQDGVDEGRTALRALEEQHRELSFLAARYVQERQTALMSRPLRSEGSLVFRREPGCLLFRTEKPRPTVMRLDEKTYQIYRPHKKQLEKFQLEDQRWQKALFQTLSHQVREIEKDFEILGSRLVSEELVRPEEGPQTARRVKMRPRDEKNAKKIKSLEIDIRVADSLVTRIAYVDSRGDEIAILLDQIDVKTKIAKDQFVLEVARDTKVITHDG